MNQGLIHIYCGDGKGKTTAALGLLLRALGRGKKAVFCQFLKSDDSGERRALQAFANVTLTPCPKTIRFVFQMNEEEKRAAAEDCLRTFRDAVRLSLAGCELLVLDEAFGAVSTGLLKKDELLSFLRSKPRELEVVLTGRDPGAEFLELADYISHIEKRKHPFDRGCAAREGIEY